MTEKVKRLAESPQGASRYIKDTLGVIETRLSELNQERPAAQSAGQEVSHDVAAALGAIHGQSTPPRSAIEQLNAAAPKLGHWI
jgi:hypothetical protein